MMVLNRLALQLPFALQFVAFSVRKVLETFISGTVLQRSFILACCFLGQSTNHYVGALGRKRRVNLDFPPSSPATVLPPAKTLSWNHRPIPKLFTLYPTKVKLIFWACIVSFWNEISSLPLPTTPISVILNWRKSRLPKTRWLKISSNKLPIIKNWTLTKKVLWVWCLRGIMRVNDTKICSKR